MELKEILPGTWSAAYWLDYSQAEEIVPDISGNATALLTFMQNMGEEYVLSTYWEFTFDGKGIAEMANCIETGKMMERLRGLLSEEENLMELAAIMNGCDVSEIDAKLVEKGMSRQDYSAMILERIEEYLNTTEDKKKTQKTYYTIEGNTVWLGNDDMVYLTYDETEGVLVFGTVESVADVELHIFDGMELTKQK